jgi:hypothetical protein
VRGQVELASLPATYGGGCPASNGREAYISASGPACLGASFEITMRGAPASVACTILFGLNRDVLGSVLLPLDLSVIGAGDCFLLHDNIAPLPTTMTDPNGCAGSVMTVPLDPALVDRNVFGQWFFLDQGANVLGVANSNGLIIPVQ